MKYKLLILFLAGILIISMFGMNSVEAKKAKKGGIAQEEVDKMSAIVDNLTKKMYANGLFSPQNNEELIDIKIKLDNQMLISPDVTLAPLYYKAGLLYKSREMKDESVECFQTILENFSDTALAPKSAAQLKSMGIEVKAVAKKEDSGGE
jgi:hypothetical protein